MNMKKLICLILATAAVIGFTQRAEAIAFTFTDARTLGFVYAGNLNANASTDETLINGLLATGLGVNMPPTFPTGGAVPTYFRTLNDPLAGSYPAAVYANLEFGPSVTHLTLTGTYEYLLAKYDGPNSYRVVWYVGDLAAGTEVDIPKYFSDYPGPGNQYAVSHTRAFNEKSNGVPDGGSTVMLLGAVIVTAGVARRFLKL